MERALLLCISYGVLLIQDLAITIYLTLQDAHVVKMLLQYTTSATAPVQTPLLTIPCKGGWGSIQFVNEEKSKLALERQVSMAMLSKDALMFACLYLSALASKIHDAASMTSMLQCPSSQ